MAEPERYDVLVALQPSTLTPDQFKNFLQAVKDGQPTAIFEDPAPFIGNFSHTKTGYTVGGGIETKFDPFGLFGYNWSVKSEYLYVDLGNVSDTYTTPLTPRITIDHILTSHVEEHVFRTGLNYHFDTTRP